MRIYSDSAEETLRARSLLKDWAGEGFLTPAQYERMQKETVSDLRTNNIFLRLVLIFFTLIIAGAVALLFLVVFLKPSSDQVASIFLVFFAGVCYATAEGAVSQSRLYRFGIEEALVVCAIGCLCAAIEIGLSGSSSLTREFLSGAAGVIASLWIWYRFGLAYAFLAAMIFVILLPPYWTSSHAAQHLIIALFYAAGLVAVVAARSRHHFDYLDDAYSLVEAFLWFGIYLALNLQLSSVNPFSRWVDIRPGTEFPRPFYWTTWVLIWCLPPIVLTRGARRKDHLVLAVGAITAVLTLATNKPYLGWPRHTWDPMLLGILLTGIALVIRRWLARGPDGIRHGFTAQRLSGRYQQLVDAASTASSLIQAESVTPTPKDTSSEFRFGGGDSGGGGASSDF